MEYWIAIKNGIFVDKTSFRWKTFFLICWSFIFLLGSCQKDKFEGEIKQDSEFAKALRSCPENINIDNNNLKLTTYLWRDFMPIAEENGSNLIGIGKLIEVDSNSILNTITLKKQYVIKGNEIWTKNYSEINSNFDYELSGVVREGPKWGPNIEVDVVCEFLNAGITYRILAKSQLINKTE